MKNMIKATRQFNAKISIKLVVLLFVGLIVPLLLALFFVSAYAKSLILEKEQENITLATSNMVEQLEDSMQTAIFNTLTTASDQLLVEYIDDLSHESKVSIEWFRKKIWVTEYLTKLAVTNGDTPHSITIIDRDYNIFSNKYAYLTSDEMKQIFAEANESYRPFVFSRNVNGEDTLTVCNLIKNSNLENIGVVMEDIPYSEIFMSDNEHYWQKYTVYCVDAQGEVFLAYHELPLDYTQISTEYEGGFLSFIKQPEYLRFQHRFRDNQFTIEVLISVDEIFHASQYFNKITILIGGLLLIQAFLCVYLIMELLVKPIASISAKLIDFPKHIAPIEIDGYLNSNDELGELMLHTERMSKQICDLIEQEKKMNEEKRRHEIAALKAQFNPHMIYNTLNTITFLAQLQGISNIEEISEAFSSLLHTQLKTVDEFVTIEKEMDYIEKYVLIKKYNITASIELIVNIETGLGQYFIVPFILQPLVENSIKHGFYNKTSMCHITINIHKKENNIHIEVKDNGHGISESKLKSIRESIDKVEISDHLGEDHIGVINTAKRLSVIYHNKSVFDITSKLNEYTRVRLEYPIEIKCE